MLRSILKYAFALLFVCSSNLFAQQPAEFVNTFIGSDNYGTTNPGPVLPNGMMSVAPFNVMGSETNKFDKDKQWWSTPYSNVNSFFTGYSHVNLSGVGCPELGSLLLMPTSGELNVDYKNYGSPYTNEKAVPGYYSNILSKYNIKTEVSATNRSSIARFTFPKGEANILMNLGEGLTNESGAWMRRVNDTEVEGMKLLGTFCYNPQAVFPIYFVMRVSKQPVTIGYWKKQRDMQGVEADWDVYSGKYKLYTKYNRDLAGDDIGAYFTYDVAEGETIEVQIGVSFVSTENARENLEKEQTGFNFDKVKSEATEAWNNALTRVRVEGGTHDEKVVFYSGLYHTLIHPNILNDVNGEYPAMETGKTMKTEGTRYTVFSLWDTYRNFHQLQTLLYPEKQINMVNTMIDMYKESGWLPKWELYGRETLTMEGDPAIPVIVDTYMKGLRNFDIDAAYEAMYKSATQVDDNFLRHDNKDYLSLGYVPLRSEFDNSVSHALEYYIADNALSKFAKALGKTDDAKRFYTQSMKYKMYFSKEYGTFRPLLPNGEFLSPFNPKQGENFEDVPGFHEGSSWNYSFMVPHDVKGLIKLMGGEKAFVKKLQQVFDEDHYDPTNEPNISYPYLFSYVKGEEWRTQKLVSELLKEHFKNSPDGLPGNDDTGTMSAWVVFSMMGFYPDNATDPSYTFTTPVFDKITLKLDPAVYGKNELVIKTIKSEPNAQYIDKIIVNGKIWKGYRISHQDFVNAGTITFHLKTQK
ncbi:MAG: GH92 family glycosyl hydrolase [Candidatus Saccharimonadaceae bacterium]